MTDTDTTKSVQAFVISRITCDLPFHATQQTDIDQANLLIRIACKAALGLPENTSTDRLSELGMTNTYDELAAATLMVQRGRLNAPPQGRSVLTRLRHPLTPQFCGDDTTLMPSDLRARIHVNSISRHMNPHFHMKWLQVRAAILRKRQEDADTYFTDAGLLPAMCDSNSYLCGCRDKPGETNRRSVRTHDFKRHGGICGHSPGHPRR
ncbi:hypothetical protein HPB49_020443 [Dermacentor silvarum]|uniref:Uncharacterized protein n=1 Tax=Dermacentor silvarum TaxID=543639 RepID=A0ACB8DQA1_DERSI|nr:hypothetical protein HPB49_020443 [Dermacentor silvarum]